MRQFAWRNPLLRRASLVATVLWLTLLTPEHHYGLEFGVGGVDVGLEPGFASHAISVPLTWNRVPPAALQKQMRPDGDIGWSTEDQLRLAFG